MGDTELERGRQQELLMLKRAFISTQRRYWAFEIATSSFGALSAPERLIGWAQTNDDGIEIELLIVPTDGNFVLRPMDDPL